MTQQALILYTIEFVYLIASVLFIFSLHWMSSPATARRGVLTGEIGMLLAICGSLLHKDLVDCKWIAISLLLGTIMRIPPGKEQIAASAQRTALRHAFASLHFT